MIKTLKACLSFIVTRLFHVPHVLQWNSSCHDEKLGKSAVLTESCVGIISTPKKDKSDLISESLSDKYSEK